jgi:hypothetical protein
MHYFLQTEENFVVRAFSLLFGVYQTSTSLNTKLIS